MVNNRAWMVRAGNDNELIDEFIENSWLAIGWADIGDLSNADSREEVKDRYYQTYDHSVSRAGVNAGQIHRFSNVMAEGDLVLTYDKSAREYHVGTVSSEYRWKPSGYPDGYPHVRDVEWDKVIDRDDFSTPVKNTLGSVLTIFSLDERREAIDRVLYGEESEEDDSDEEEDVPAYHEDVEATAEDLISDIIANIDPFDFEELVAALLRAMDYSTKLTSDGADYGVDIIAHPDALGFEEPLVKVQVKHRESKMGSSDIRDFIGTLDSGEMGLYVSSGGYTSSAHDEVERTSSRITLLDRDDFIELLIEHYDDIDSEYKAFVPLTPVYIPTKEP